MYNKEIVSKAMAASIIHVSRVGRSGAANLKSVVEIIKPFSSQFSTSSKMNKTVSRRPRITFHYPLI